MMRRERAGDPIDPYVPADEGPEVPARPAMAAKTGAPVARVYGTDVVPGRLVYLRASEGYLEKFKDYGTGWQSAKCAAGHVVIAFAEAVDGVTYEVVQFWRGKNKYLPGQAWTGGGYTHAWADSRLVSHDVEGYADGEVSYVLTKNAGAWPGFDGDAAGMTMRGLCQMRALWLTLPDSRVGDFKYELRGQFAGGAPQPDADPADVVKDLIAIADPGRIVEVDIGPGGTAASGFRTYCAANGFRVSRGIDVATVDIELVEDLLAACDSMLVWSDGKWKAVPLGDRAIGSYVPPATAVALNEDEWLRDGTDSPTLRVERIPADQIFDCYPIRIHERASAYELATYEYIDPVAGSGPGELVRADPMQSDWVKTAGHALRLSAILASRAKRVRNRFRGRLPARWAILDPGDIVSITHEPLGLTNALARIRRVEVQEDGAVEVEAEEWPTGTAVTVDLTPATHDGLTQAPIPPARSDAALAAAATAVTALLTNESHVAPAAADGSSPDLVGATTEMQVLVGGLDDSANWTFAKVAGLGVVATLVGPVLTITGLTVDASYVDITASHPDLAPVTRRFTIAKARAGATGPQGEQGVPGAAAPLVRLAATAQTFTFDGAGALSPASQTITFTVTRTNITEAAAVTCTRYDAAGASLGTVTLGGSGDTRTLTSAQFGAAARAVVVATAVGQTDRMTAVRLRDGAAGTPGATGAPGADGADGENAVVGYLTNEAVTVAADAAGVVGGGFGSAGGTFKVFDGLAEKTGAGVAYSVVSETGVDVSIGAATGVYSVASMSADTGTAVLRAIYAGVAIEKTFTIAKSKAGPQGPQGQAGADGDSVDIIFQRASSQPATPAGSAGVPAGWSSSVASAPGTGLLWSCVGTKAGSASTYTWETPARIEGEDGTDGATGATGSAGLSVAEVSIYRRSSTAPATPTAGSFTFPGTLTPPTDWSATVPAGSAPLYVSRAVASISGTSGTDSTLTWTAPVILAQDGAQGSTGATGAPGAAGDSLDIVFRRSPAQPATPSASAGTPTGWYSDVASVPSGADPMWSCVGTRTGGASTYTWQVPVRLEGLDGATGTTGAAGLSVAELTIYLRAASAPATPTAGSYNFGTQALTPPAGWSMAIPAGTDPVYTSRAVASVQGTTGTDSTLTWSSPVLSLQNGAPGTNGTNGATGARGSLTLSQNVAPATAWNSTTATAYVTGKAESGGVMRLGDTLTQYNDAANFAHTRFWDGSAWQALTVKLDGNLLVNGTLGADKFVGRAFQTDDYAEDASGNPIAGFKAYAGSYSGTPQFKVGPLGGRVGKENLNEAAVAAVSALARTGVTDNDRVWYRGNSWGAPVLMDPAWSSTTLYAVGRRALQGGNVYRCLVQHTNVAPPNATYWALVGTMADQERIIVRAMSSVVNLPGSATWAKYKWWIGLRPRDLYDNLDAIRYGHVVVCGSDGGNVEESILYLPDRKYGTASIDDAAGNEVGATLSEIFNSTMRYATGDQTFNGFLKISVQNCFGAATRYFSGASAAWAVYPGGVTIPTQPSVPSPTEPSVPGGGGKCVAPETPIAMADGSRRPAGDLVVGDEVWTRHERTGEWGAFPVTHHSVHAAERVRVLTTDGRALVCSDPHRLAASIGWTGADALPAGMQIDGMVAGVVAAVERVTRGPVVLMTVGDAHTYVAEGLLSHNVKGR
jgi:Putative phage tail protein